MTRRKQRSRTNIIPWRNNNILPRKVEKVLLRLTIILTLLASLRVDVCCVSFLKIKIKDEKSAFLIRGKSIFEMILEQNQMRLKQTNFQSRIIARTS